MIKNRTALAIIVAVAVCVLVSLHPITISEASEPSIALFDSSGPIPEDRPLLDGYMIKYDTVRDCDVTTYIIQSGTKLDLDGTFLRIIGDGDFTLEAEFFDVNGYLAETGIRMTFTGNKTYTIDLDKENNFKAYSSTKVTQGDYVLSMYTLSEYRSTVIPEKVEDMTMSFTIDDDVYEYHIQADCGDGGSIDPSGDVTVPLGESKTFRITPDASYVIKDVTVDGVSKGPIDTYVFESVNQDHTIHAEFERLAPPSVYYTLSYDANGADAGTVPSAKTYPSGTSVPIASADGLSKEGYFFCGWNTAADGSGRTYYPGNILVLGRDTVLYAEWSPVPVYTITVIQTDNGTITPDTVIVQEGSAATFEIKPNDGYAVHEVFVDGESVGSMERYTFENVHENHTISAVYEKKGCVCDIWLVILIAALIVATLVAVIVIARRKAEEQ